MSSGLARIFVYGTLMPGHLRWELLASVSTAHRRADVAGRLFDTGYGWPAACLVDGEVEVLDLVPGWVVEVRPESLDDVLHLLDQVEDGFDRVTVTTRAGEAAWAYSVPSGVPDTWVPITAWTGQGER